MLFQVKSSCARLSAPLSSPGQAIIVLTRAGSVLLNQQKVKDKTALNWDRYCTNFEMQ